MSQLSTSDCYLWASRTAGQCYIERVALTAVCLAALHYTGPVEPVDSVGELRLTVHIRCKLHRLENEIRLWLRYSAYFGRRTGDGNRSYMVLLHAWSMVRVFRTDGNVDNIVVVVEVVSAVALTTTCDALPARFKRMERVFAVRESFGSGPPRFAYVALALKVELLTPTSS